MFLESEKRDNREIGSIEVICGSMFSGKTEELLRRLKRAKFANLKLIVFKPEIDIRYDKKKVVSHDSNSIISKVVKSASEILSSVNDENIVAIDEAQFFNNDLITVCNSLANNGKRVIVAGLDMDFLGNPFGVIPQLLAIAEHVTKVHAICMHCGRAGQYSFRIEKTEELVQLGEKNKYKALCRKCFNDSL